MMGKKWRKDISRTSVIISTYQLTHFGELLTLSEEMCAKGRKAEWKLKNPIGEQEPIEEIDIDHKYLM